MQTYEAPTGIGAFPFLITEKDADAIRAMLSVMAIAKGARTHPRFLFEYSDEEKIDFQKQLLGS